MSCAVPIKRTASFLDAAEQHPHQSPRAAHAFLESKRCRLMTPPHPAYVAPYGNHGHGMPAAAAAAGLHGHGGLGGEYPHNAPLRARDPNCIFVPKSCPDDVGKFFPDLKRRRTRKDPSGFPTHHRGADPDSAPSSQQQSDDGSMAVSSSPIALRKKDQPIFTEPQVRAIVEKALAERTQQLSEEFHHILLEKLDEQFNVFSKIQEDYIHKKMSESTFSYMS